MTHFFCRKIMQRTSRPIFYLFTLAIVASMWGCARQTSGPAYVKNGKEYGKVQGAFFRHRWWNYYERGLSFAEGEFLREALADLKEAIDQRDKDQRMARTYGMHFIDYFPHRELGIIHYQMGNFQDAKRELEVSLSQYPSAKARFYLDHVRKALIEEVVKEVPPPRLSLAFLTEEVWTREHPVRVSGVAEDENYVAAITILGSPLFLEGSEKRIPFEERLVLPQGRHVIDVAAKNLVGKVTERRVVIHVDREGPIIALDEIGVQGAGPYKEVRISGSVFDEAGVAALSVNGQAISIQEGSEVPFAARLTIDAGSLDLLAQDRLGNRTSAQIPFAPSSVSDRPVLLASARTHAGGFYSAGLFGPSDVRPPIIKLKGWTDIQTVYLEKAYIQGHVSDDSKVESLTINEISILRRPGRYIVFSHLADLGEGENRLAVEARDEADNASTKIIAVTRRVPKALQLQERLSLTVFPFEQKGEVSGTSLAFQDNLIDALVDRNRFQVIERDKLDLILQEQKLSRTKLFDQSTALKLGSLAAARSIIAGSIIESRIGIEVVARMIDTETSDILATADVYSEVKDLPALSSLAEGMAIKFHRDFPLVDGLILECKGEDIFTDLGSDVVKLRRRLIVYRDEPIKHPMSGQVLGADNKIMGHARVVQVMPKMSKAELTDVKSEKVKSLDKVITE